MIVSGRPFGEVMQKLAHVLGAALEHVGPPDGRRYRLARSSAVSAWLKRRERERAAAERFARGKQTEFIRGVIDEMLSHADEEGWKPPGGDHYDRDLARFLKTFPPDVFDRFAQDFGDTSSVEAGAPSTPGNPVLKFTLQDLSPSQRNMFTDYLINEVRRGGSGDDGLALMAGLPNIGFSLMTPDHVGVSIVVDSASLKLPPGGVMSFDATGRAMSPDGLEQHALGELNRRMAGKEIPQDALLGARFGPDGRPEPAVKFENAEMGSRPVRVPTAQPLRWQLLVDLADAAKTNVIADYYTRGERIDVGAENLGELLQKAADKYDTVFRQSGPYLLARRTNWPDDDRKEIPGPWAEQWSDAVVAGKSLLFEDVARMATLTESHLNGLAAYVDRRVGAPFISLVSAARNPPARGLLALYSKLPDSVKMQVRGESGMRCADLPAAFKKEIAGHGLDLPQLGKSRLVIRMPDIRTGPRIPMAELRAEAPDKQDAPFILSTLWGVY